MQRHTDQTADPHLIDEVLWHEVVELFVEPRDIGYHPSDRDGRIDARQGQAPTARMKSSRRLNCSQVNSGRLRPK